MGRVIQVLLLMACCQLVEAAVYKWTDEQGRTHYGDRPAEEKSEQIRLTPAPAAGHSQPGRAERDAKRRRLLDVYREEREKKQAAAEKQKQERADRKQKCQQAKRRYARFNHAGGIYDSDESGERRYLEDDERARYIAGLQAEVERWCGK